MLTVLSVGRLLKSWDSDDDFLLLVESEHSAGGKDFKGREEFNSDVE